MWNSLVRLPFAAKVAMLGGCVALMSMAVIPVAFWNFGIVGTQAACAAAAVCLAGAILALTAAHLLSSPTQAMYGILLGMAARTGLPLVATLVVIFRLPGWISAGWVAYLLLFYFLTLIVETALAVSGIRAVQRSSKSS